MAITATVKIYLKFEGDVSADRTLSVERRDSPAMTNLLDLHMGQNDVLVPSFNEAHVNGFVLVPPDGNTVEPVLKGDAGDFGFILSASAPSMIQFGSFMTTTIFINVPAEAPGFRIIWF